MNDMKTREGKFGNVYLIDYSTGGIHSYSTVGMGSNGPYNDDHYDCEIIDGEPYHYKSGGGGNVKEIIEREAEYPENCKDMWIDFGLLSSLGLEFPDETRAKFLPEPRLLVTGNPEHGMNPLDIQNETYAGFCTCSICGPLVDENDMMCDHLVYTPFGTDEYAGIGNDDIRCAWYALRYIGKDAAMSCVEYQYSSWWRDMNPFSGEDIERDDVIAEWCEDLKSQYGFCPATIEDAIMVWRGVQLLGSIDNEAREKMPDGMAKLREIIGAYPYESSKEKRPISKEDLPITVDGVEIVRTQYNGDDFVGVKPDGSTIDLTTIFIDHVSMETKE
jgi:hypothetical protein